MIDEMDELRRANPVAPDALKQAVAMDPKALIEALEADSLSTRPRLRLLVGRPSPSATRVGYIGAMAAAAAVLIGVVMIGGEDSPVDPDVVEPADESTRSTALVVDLDQDQRPSGSVPTTAVTVTTPEANLSESAAVAHDQDPTPTTRPGMAAPTTADDSDRASKIDGPFNGSQDLLVLHYDHAHLDDGHAAVAALEIATWFGFQPHVVAGTSANDNDGYVHKFGPVMQAAWGNSWLDAHLDRSGAVRRSVERWLLTLDSGGRIWVAEGGASDFTADVVRELQRQRPGLDTGSVIHVVQHNNRNESESSPENLAFLQAKTVYERIDDGNDTNGTANLNQPSEAFVASALAGQHASSWSAAFEYLSPDELDFSDTVEVLHILGVGADEVANPDDFADRFMG